MMRHPCIHSQSSVHILCFLFGCGMSPVQLHSLLVSDRYNVQTVWMLVWAYKPSLSGCCFIVSIISSSIWFVLLVMAQCWIMLAKWFEVASDKFSLTRGSSSQGHTGTWDAAQLCKTLRHLSNENWQWFWALHEGWHGAPHWEHERDEGLLL